MRCPRYIAVASLLTLIAVVCSADPPDPIAVFKTGDYEKAIPLLRGVMAQDSKDPIIYADLLSALVYIGQVDEATDLEGITATKFPNSPEVLAARGEFFFYMGDIPRAEKLFRTAIGLQDGTPRAVFGMYRIYRMASLYRTGRLLCLKAHEVDPDDARITVSWLNYLTPDKRKELLGPFIAAHPWFYKHYKEAQQTDTEITSQTKEKEIFEAAGPRQETTLNFSYIYVGPNRPIGVALQLTIPPRKPIKLLFDTGASGIVLNQGVVDKASLAHLGSFQIYGIGDAGERNSFASVAPECSIGSLKYKNCAFEVIEGKNKVGDEVDGLIGADFFEDYIVEIDFQKRLLHLKPQPERPPNPQGYDRTIPPGEAGFTPVFREGHQLFVLTTVNGKSTGLFLLDTGSAGSSMDSTFARLFTKIHYDDYTRVSGLSGDVKKVFEADSAELQFAHFRQRNLGLTSFNLNNGYEHEEVRMAGIMGIPLLSLFRLTIDYRNGLVNFDNVIK